MLGAGLQLSLIPELQRITSASPGQSDVLVLPLEARAIGGPVDVASVAIGGTGGIAEDMDIVEALLYRDIDGDGRVSENDELISQPATFDMDEGSATLALNGVSVDTLVG